MPDKRNENLFAFAMAALHGMCVGGTVVANLLEDTPTQAELESQKKSAQEIARASFVLARAMQDEFEKSTTEPTA